MKGVMGQGWVGKLKSQPSSTANIWVPTWCNKSWISEIISEIWRVNPQYEFCHPDINRWHDSRKQFEVVFESLVQSSLWASRGMDWYRDQSSQVQRLQKTRPNQCKPVLCSLMQFFMVMRLVSTSYGWDQLLTGWDWSSLIYSHGNTL